jgi:predicted metal-dependent enzyme (double-stranded beta helix superfamily)
MAVMTLQDFVREMEELTRAETDPRRLTELGGPLLQQLVSNPDTIEERFKRGGTDGHGRYMLHRAPHFNVTAVVWRPNDTAKAHNHETWGMIGVIGNEIQETRFRRLDDGTKEGYADIEVTEVLVHKPRAVSLLVPPEDDIHEMLNPTPRDTVEIHVYGKDLVALQRLRFDPATQSVRTFCSPKYDNC